MDALCAMVYVYRPSDLRWRAVFGVWYETLSFKDCAERLSMRPMQVDARFVERMWELYEDTGDVASRQDQREAPPANLIMDDAACDALFEQLLANPEYTLRV